MIQRIQTLFLILAVAAFTALFAFPMASSDEAAEGFFSDSQYAISDHIILVVLVVLGVLLALISIFLFKRRTLQIRFGYLLIVIGILIPGLAYLLFTTEAANLPSGLKVEDEFGLFLPFIAIVCVAIANYFIRKDDRLVKSMDRLR